VVGIDLNIEGIKVLEEVGIKLPELFFYFVIDKDKQVVWHSGKSFTSEQYSLVDYIFAENFPPSSDSEPTYNKDEVDEFQNKIEQGVKSKELEFSNFTVNGKKVLFARSPITLRFSEFNSDPKDASVPPDF